MQTTSRFAIIIALLSSAIIGYSQEQSPENRHSAESGQEDVAQNKIWELDELAIKPTYPGGIKEFYKYISNNYKFPKQDVIEKTSGIIYIKFIVDQHGNIDSVQVLPGINERMDQEAVRVITSCQKWTPGRIGDKPVAVSFKIPLRLSPQ